jgi:2-keto-4-pentenoate hydratase/2-oxohepta-3-ene-1,7-dioic acid hydratase in catechol pathway
MKYASFSTSSSDAIRLGAVRGDRLVDVTALMHGGPFAQAAGTLLDLVIAGYEAWTAVAVEVESTGASAPGHALTDVTWHAPIPRPRKNIACLGLNYSAHISETAAALRKDAKVPTMPVIFTKAPTTVNGPFSDIVVDRRATSEVDWEVELGVVIGRTGKNIHAARAYDYVFGYTVLNDVTARDLQKGHVQFYKGKSLDGFCPMGPVVVTADEFGDPQQKRLTCRVNGVVKQDGTTANMIFPVTSIIEWLSKGLTIEAGDLIATGTPDGVGMGRTPPEYLQNGDVLETEVEGIGLLRNTIVG